jgi:hypothetical protein
MRAHRHLPPLTAAELAALYEENPLPVVRQLLWEIHRLHGTIRTAQAARVAIGTRVGTANTPANIWELFERELDAEPCLAEEPKARQPDAPHDDETEGRRKRRMRNGG